MANSSKTGVKDAFALARAWHPCSVCGEMVQGGKKKMSAHKSQKHRIALSDVLPQKKKKVVKDKS